MDKRMDRQMEMAEFISFLTDVVNNDGLYYAQHTGQLLPLFCVYYCLLQVKIIHNNSVKGYYSPSTRPNKKLTKNTQFIKKLKIIYN